MHYFRAITLKRGIRQVDSKNVSDLPLPPLKLTIIHILETCCYSTYPVRDKIFVTIFLVYFYSVGIKYTIAFLIYNPYGISTVKGYSCYKYIIPTE